jgi:imidazole glycerol phosphate synthase subunit HisF
VAVRSGQELVALDAVAWAVEATRRGAGEVLLTAWDRDGMQSGYDLELIGEVVAAVAVPVVASGGAAGPRDLAAAWRAGAQGALVASILHDGAWTVRGLKEAAREEGVEVRGCS